MNPDLLEMMAGRPGEIRFGDLSEVKRTFQYYDHTHLVNEQYLKRMIELQTYLAATRPFDSPDYGDINEEERQRRHEALLEKHPVQSDWVQG